LYQGQTACLLHRSLFQFCVHRGKPINRLLPYTMSNEMSVPSWSIDLPRQHVNKHLLAFDSSRPAIVKSCLYSVSSSHHYSDLLSTIDDSRWTFHHRSTCQLSKFDNRCWILWCWIQVRSSSR